MNVSKDNLIIRDATVNDAEQLCMWWNDGEIMAHAGFPNGLGITAGEISKSLATDADETHRRHIIELDGRPIGEMNYRNKGGNVAEIGIKICDFTAQGKGLGTTLLSMFIDALFTQYGYHKIILDTGANNKRAQHVYEKKLGLKMVGVRENAWRDQLGELQSAVDYELTKQDWLHKGILKLRPHHLLCLILFEPKGYDAVYIDFMQELIEKLTANPQTQIFLTDGLCVTCGYCPHNDDGKCLKEAKVRVIVANILELTGLDIGVTMSWEKLRKRALDTIIRADRFHEACGACSYFEQCKDMISRAINI